MKALDVARKVTTESTCHLVRPRLNTPGEYDTKPFSTGSKRGWFFLDLYTASAIVKVHENLNETNKPKFEAMPLPKMAFVAMKLVG